MTSTRPRWERLRTILERQEQAKFGPDYQPAIRATPREAPSISRCAVVQSAKLRREVHLLSTPELHAALLALYHPNLFDLHEQKMLSVDPQPHPLFSHPTAVGLRLSPVCGTVVVAERLGHIDLHPKVKAPSVSKSKEWMWVPYPFIGDLLLFLTDRGGPYCVNWTTKLTREDFVRPLVRTGPIKKPAVAFRRIQARQEIERDYYADAGIHTVQIAGTDINKHVAANLRQLYGWQLQTIKLSENLRVELHHKFETALDLKIPPIDIIAQFMMRHLCRREDCLAVLYQSIWRRLIRVDLFRPVLVDRALHLENRDVLVEYKSWFERKPCTLAFN